MKINQGMGLSIVIMRLIELVFPRRETERRVAAVNALEPRRASIVIDGVTIHFALSYADPAVRSLITEAKFHNHHHAQKLLGIVTKDALATLAVCDRVIPMPLSNRRYRERGYNQLEQILHAGGVTYAASLLTRTHTQPQTELDRSRRRQNVAGSFTLASGAEIAGKHLVLIDDVVTTGATMLAARAELARHSPASITCFALAH